MNERRSVRASETTRLHIVLGFCDCHPHGARKQNISGIIRPVREESDPAKLWWYVEPFKTPKEPERSKLFSNEVAII